MKRDIFADIRKEKGSLDRFFSACIGAGRAGEIMRYVPMQQLRKIQKECPFRYIRFHGLFHEEMNVVQRAQDGTLSFCFMYMDMLFDMLLEVGLRPIVELGLMPDTVAKDKAYVFWWKMNKSMPQDIREWEMLVEATVRHLSERYGEEEVKNWYFEVWNEPNHPGFFTEYQNIEKYFVLYDAAAHAVKRVCAAYRVGGPATAGMGWLPEMVSHCRENDVPLDFLTSHSYGVKGDFDPEGNAVTVLRDVDKVSKEIRVHGARCKEWGLPLFITEWSSSYSPADRVHDSYYSAPYILRTTKRCEGFAEAMSYWTFTDIFEENGPPTEPFHGGFGLLNVQSIPKPAYHAYKFLARLGDAEISCEDEDAYVCRSERGVQILFWNVQAPRLEGYGNRTYFGKKVPAEEIEDAQITLAGMTLCREYTVVWETVGDGAGDAYGAYLDMGAPKTLLPAETDALMKASEPKKECFTVRADENGTLSFALPQKENEAAFLEILF